MRASPATVRDPVTVVWLLLVVATGVTWAVGESGAGGHLAAMAVLAIAALKGGGVALVFMELRDAPRLYGALVLGWLVTVAAIIGVAFARAGA